MNFEQDFKYPIAVKKRTLLTALAIRSIKRFRIEINQYKVTPGLALAGPGR